MLKRLSSYSARTASSVAENGFAPDHDVRTLARRTRCLAERFSAQAPLDGFSIGSNDLDSVDLAPVDCADSGIICHLFDERNMAAVKKLWRWPFPFPVI